MFKGLFGKEERFAKQEGNTIPWVPLTSVEQLDEIIEKSASRTQIIFKHSTTCGISRMVFNRFGKDFDFHGNQVDPYYLDLHSYRQVSNETATRFQVVHQSPQLLIIKNGVVAAHSSHGGITDMNLSEWI